METNMILEGYLESAKKASSFLQGQMLYARSNRQRDRIVKARNDIETAASPGARPDKQEGGERWG